MNFRLFESGEDIFGFEDIEARKEKKEQESDDELPLRAFNVQWMMDVLSRKKINKRIKSSDAFLDHVVWGNPKSDGSIRVRLTPNIEIYIERRTTDKEGAGVWILKRVFKPKLKEFAGQEEIVANDTFEEVEKLYDEKIDSAADEYDSLMSLAKRMATRIRSHAPLIYNYQDTKEVNKSYYIISFAIRNAGVGKLVTRGRTQGQSPEVTIDVNFNKERGLIHVILGTVSAGAEGSGWEVDLPYLDSWYAPSQDKDEIIDTVLTALKYY